MHLLSMAKKNLVKSFSFYSLYLVSVSFVITVFFAFTSFSVNKVMLEKISSDGRVETMCNTISIFLMAFVIFYMAYSNRFFLRRRTKELGIYALLGYRKSTILKLLTFENILLCFGALIIGLVLGAFTHKGIVAGITWLLQLSIDSAQIPMWNGEAILKTVIFIAIVVFILLISNGWFIYKVTLMKLIRYEKSADRMVTFHRIPAILGFAMILGGYALALDILRGRKSLWITVGFSPVGLLTLCLIVFGTALFISSFLPYIIQRSKKNEKAFFTGIKIITIPNFIYRIRSNTKTLIMLTLLSAATLTISTVMALTLYYPIAAVSRIAPSELELRLESPKQADEISEIVEQYIPNRENVVFTETVIYKVSSNSKDLPEEYSIGSSKHGSNNEEIVRTPGFEVMSLSGYQALLRAQGTMKLKEVLDHNECILLKYQPGNGDETGKKYPLLINHEEIPVTVKNTSLNNVISFANSIGTIVVSDNLFQQIKQANLPSVSILSLNGKNIEKNEELYHKISEYLQGSPYLQGQSHRISELLSLNSSTFLLIGFLVVLFFIAAGSILYFNNISAVTDSKNDYEILQKIGYTKKQMKQIIKTQVFTFFSIPFLLGMLDCIFAAIVYKKGLMQDLLGSTLVQYVPVLIAVFMTVILYLIYYIVTVRSCCKIIFKGS